MAIAVSKQHLRGRSSRQTVNLDTDQFEEVAIGAAANRSAAINADFIQIVATTDCYLKFGDVTINAVVNEGVRIPANTPIIYNWVRGEFLSVIDAAAVTGVINIVGAY